MTGPKCDCCENFLLRLCHVLGLATALGLWGVGVEAIFYHHNLGFYLVPLAVIITFLETVFLLHYCVEICVSPGSACVGVWKGVLWLDDWRKGVLYLLLSIPCFLCPKTVLLGVVCGAMLALTGVLYSIKTYKTRQAAAVEQFISKRSYGRFEEDELEEDPEDNIVNPTANISAMSVADQIEVLEV